MDYISDIFNDLDFKKFNYVELLNEHVLNNDVLLFLILITFLILLALGFSNRVVIFNEGLVNVVQQYVKKGANVYIEGQLSTRKWKDEATGQDKYSTEVILQGYNSSLTMLDSRNTTNNSNLVSENKSSLPNDNLNQDSPDLDDEIPF